MAFLAAFVTAMALLLASPADALPADGDEILGVIIHHSMNTSNITNHFHTNAEASNYCLGAYDLDFIGGDFTSTKGSAETCCDQCKRFPACQSYTWTDYEGGTCWLKNTIGFAKVYSGAKAVIITKEPATYQTAQFSNCDMPGNDFDFTQMAEEDFLGCENACWQRGWCKAVTWTNYNGGTCWFKSGVAPCKYTPGARTSLPFSEYQ